MPLQVSWDNDEKTIIRSESEGVWTWDEYHAALDEVAAMMRSVNHRVDLITLRHTGATMPPGSPLPYFRRSMKVLPDNHGINVFVARSAFAINMIAVFTRIYSGMLGGKHLIVGTIEEARAMIARERAKTNPASLTPTAPRMSVPLPDTPFSS